MSEEEKLYEKIQTAIDESIEPIFFELLREFTKEGGDLVLENDFWCSRGPRHCSSPFDVILSYPGEDTPFCKANIREYLLYFFESEPSFLKPRILDTIIALREFADELQALYDAAPDFVEDDEEGQNLAPTQ